jgi:hypothetical protein
MPVLQKREIRRSARGSLLLLRLLLAAVGVPDFNEFDRLVPSVTPPLASSAALPRRSPRLLKAPKLTNFEVTSKKKVLVQAFKSDDTAIHAWIRKGHDPGPVASASSLKFKAQNNF